MFGQHLVDGLRARLEVLHDALVVLGEGFWYQLVHVFKLCLRRADLFLQRTQLIALDLGRMMPLLCFSYKVLHHVLYLSNVFDCSFKALHHVLDLSKILDCYESSQPFKLLDNRTKNYPVIFVFCQHSIYPFITRRLDEVLDLNWVLIDMSTFRRGLLGRSTWPCFRIGVLKQGRLILQGVELILYFWV